MALDEEEVTRCRADRRRMKQAEHRVPVAEVTHKAGISEQTFYRWVGGVCMPGGGPGRSDVPTAGRGTPVEEACGRVRAGQDDAAGCSLQIW